MAQLIVRRLEDEVVAALRKRAAENGQSVEALHREILRAATRTRPEPSSLKSLLLEMPAAGRDSDFARPRRKARPVRL